MAMNYQILSILFTKHLIHQKIFDILNLKNVSHLSNITFHEIYTSSIVLRYKSALLLSKLVIESGILDVLPIRKEDYNLTITILGIMPFLEKRNDLHWSASKHILEDPFYPYHWKKNKTQTSFKILRKHREIMENKNVNAILNHAYKPKMSYIRKYYLDF